MTDETAGHRRESTALLHERVMPALERQAALYDELAAFGPKQDELIAQGEGDELLRLMAERQHVVDQLVEVHQGLEDVREDWQVFVGGLDEGDRAELGKRLDAVKALAGRVHEQDSRTRATLDGAKDRVQSDLTDLGRGKGAMRAYAGATARVPIHQDREA
ncbi:MAG: hypothetical protein ACFCBV_08930 [Phycisphaerales bacterium]|nr:flagellar protein FliT [Phycisphaerales bacterium]